MLGHIGVAAKEKQEEKWSTSEKVKMSHELNAGGMRLWHTRYPGSRKRDFWMDRTPKMNYAYVSQIGATARRLKKRSDRLITKYVTIPPIIKKEPPG